MKQLGQKKKPMIRVHSLLWALLTIMTFASVLAGSADAAGTPAGTIINNMASVRYTIGTNTLTQNSNIDAITVVSSTTVNTVKTVVVLDQYGGNQPITGATLRYTLAVTATGNGPAFGVVVTDAIPATTMYTPGTLRLNGVSLSDVLDADAGDVGGTTAGTVTVRLGDLTSASPVQTITFDVKIN